MSLEKRADDLSEKIHAEILAANEVALGLIKTISIDISRTKLQITLSAVDKAKFKILNDVLKPYNAQFVNAPPDQLSYFLVPIPEQTVETPLVKPEDTLKVKSPMDYANEATTKRNETEKLRQEIIDLGTTTEQQVVEAYAKIPETTTGQNRLSPLESFVSDFGAVSTDLIEVLKGIAKSLEVIAKNNEMAIDWKKNQENKAGPEQQKQTIKTRTLEDIRMSFPEEIENKLAFEETTDYFIIKTKEFLGSNFPKVANAIQGMGGEYISAGKDSHFRIAKDRNNRPTGEQQDYERDTAGKAKTQSPFTRPQERPAEQPQDVEVDQMGIKWHNAIGANGPFKLAKLEENEENGAFCELHSRLQGGDKTAQFGGGYFTWLFDDGITVGRKPKKKKS